MLVNVLADPNETITWENYTNCDFVELAIISIFIPQIRFGRTYIWNFIFENGVDACTGTFLI